MAVRVEGWLIGKLGVSGDLEEIGVLGDFGDFGDSGVFGVFGVADFGVLGDLAVFEDFGLPLRLVRLLFIVGLAKASTA